MLFNSLEFFLFLPLVYFFYWINRDNYRIQNIIIVIASYIFYGWWDWRFLSLIILSTILDFKLGNKLYRNIKHRKFYLSISLIFNLGLLGFFKYYNFFIDSLIESFSLININLDIHTLNIILPVGISFYTFQTLSYSIDIYNKKLKPTKNFIEFSAFVSFFPQLVAGPIERATNLLPQFQKTRKFNYANSINGLIQISFGFFKKIVIADNCSEYVNLIFSNYENFDNTTLILGAILFAFQIYGDFSGYSDIAIGVSKLFGFKLMQNFKTPYFSKNIGEFWRRWHISLSTWFRDYLYIPLGGSRVSYFKQVRNTLIIFVVSGFWHGANWTFIFWGLLNALYFIPLIKSNKKRKFKQYDTFSRLSSNKIYNTISIITTFMLITFAWIFFRSPTLNDSFNYIFNIFSNSNSNLSIYSPRFYQTIILLVVFLFIEWKGKDYECSLFLLRNIKHKFIRHLLYGILLYMILIFGNFSKNEFIYFAF